ncbi:aldehyde dehydrogenase family protein [Mesorhizobium sp. WSM4976]|uniref:aldehyde dehydrogenase family protein n=1 Tax=Mesorhizobium sp. WSM4976 TaxID=3038549 RepID=UPI002417E414|nr:aldehyde dehydrogenase family protein [Mesorhizobium sp. WSM4976]MDG4898557.1 aldehyde dehydrogenase family protein [Mesorhizobium sp. WSM4976]
MSAQELQDRIDNEAARKLAPVMSFVDGKDVGSIDGRRMKSVSPIDGAVLTDFPDSGTPDVDAAVVAARRAFVDRRWSGLGRRERKKVLLRFAEVIARHQFELGVLQSRDMGMPVSMAINMDAGEAANTIRWYAEALDKLSDELLPLSERETGLIAKVPVGVVGVIVPWNFPLMIAAWKLGPALASGNTVVLKPAEDASLALVRLAQLASEAGVPDGVLNVVTGRGETAGRALALHRDVDALTFTGSGRVGGLVLQYAGQSNLKRVSLECGGKTANIVLADAPDLEEAAQTAARAIFRNQGQICNAPSRLLVEASIHDDFVKRVVEIASTLRTGSPLKLDSDLGPVVNAHQLSGITAAIENAATHGAVLRLDGRSAAKPAQGSYLGPTIATEVDPASALAQEEVFGPVLAVISISNLDHGIEIANGTRYGLGAAVWTRDIDKALYASERLHAGSVFVNAAGGVNVEMPFGGFKESGFGRDRSLHAFDKFTDIKATLIRRSGRNIGETT